MRKAYVPPVDRTIDETARGDLEALASRIVPVLAGGGYCIVPANGMEASPLGSQPFDELTPEIRPQDIYRDGRDWTFETSEHGGDEPDKMPQAIRRPMQKGAGRSVSRLFWAARSWFRAHLRSPTRIRGRVCVT